MLVGHEEEDKGFRSVGLFLLMLLLSPQSLNSRFQVVR